MMSNCIFVTPISQCVMNVRKLYIMRYLDYYNNRRIKLKLKGLTPAQHRYQPLQAA